MLFNKAGCTSSLITILLVMADGFTVLAMPSLLVRP
jgi:hypothetical protein